MPPVADEWLALFAYFVNFAAEWIGASRNDGYRSELLRETRMEAIGDDGAVNPTGDLQSSKPTSKVETSGIVQPPRERLSPSAVRLIVMLRPKLSLMRTAARFPHIVNGLARAASEPRLLLAQLDKLLHDERGDREGFPFQVIVELTHLRELYEQEAARC